MKFTTQARLARVEYMTYINTVLISSQIGIPLITYLWGIFF